MGSFSSQKFPVPAVLFNLVDNCRYKDYWKFSLEDLDRGQGSEGLTLVISIICADSYDHSKRRGVVHYMPVPPAAFNEASWRRWFFDQVLLVEQHEVCEFFEIDGFKPYAPNHGPGNDPYTIREMTTDEERRTSYRGEVKS